MSLEIRYVVPGRPVTWQRKRLDARRGKPQTFTAASQRSAMALHAVACMAEMVPGDRARCLADTKARWSVSVAGYWPDERVGDADRMLSLVMDALEGVVYRTDRQVRHVGELRIEVDSERPRTEVVVRRIG